MTKLHPVFGFYLQKIPWRQEEHPVYKKTLIHICSHQRKTEELSMMTLRLGCTLTDDDDQAFVLTSLMTILILIHAVW
jgi:hypothetical protein